MASDSNDRIDEVVINGEDDPGSYGNHPTLVHPGESGSKAAWAAYCVDLGTDSTATEGLTKAELVELASRLGG